MLTISKMVEENLIIEDKERECHVRPNSQHDLLVISREKEKTEKKIDKHILEV